MDEHLATYGDAAGTAFQLRDDVLDLADHEPGSAAAVDDGDTLGANAVVRRSLEIATPRDRHTISTLLATMRRAPSAHLAHELAAAARETGAVEWAEERIAELHHRAESGLAGLPTGATQALRQLALAAAYRSH